MGEDDSHLDFMMDNDYIITTFIVGIFSLIACSIIIYRGRERLESLRTLCWQIIIFHGFYIATATIVMCYFC